LDRGAGHPFLLNWIALFQSMFFRSLSVKQKIQAIYRNSDQMAGNVLALSKIKIKINFEFTIDSALLSEVAMYISLPS